MAILSNINGKFRVDSAGAVYFGTSAGADGQILKSVGTGGSPVWIPQSDIVGDYLPLSGGTLTGATATASGVSFTVGGVLTGQANSNTFGTASASGRALIVQSGSSNQAIMLKNNLGGDGTISATSTATTMNYSFGTYSVAPALFIQNDGKVGIGTDSPGTKLTVNQTKSGTGIENYDLIELGLLGTGAVGDSSTIGWFSTSGVKTAGIEGISGLDNILYGELAFHVRRYTTDSYDRVMTINNRGYVGIGTTSPDAKLHIYGSASLSEMYLGEDAAADKAGILKYTQGNGSGTGVITLSHWGNNSLIESLAIKYGGNVGIGTTSPNAPLDVTSKTSGSSGIQQWSYNSSPSSYRLQLNTIVSSGLVKFSFDQLNAGASYNNALVLDRGNVGIGTDSPTARLEVAGAMNVFGTNTTIVIGESGAGGTFGFIGWNDASNFLYIGNSYGSAFNKNIVISDTGKVFIGKTVESFSTAGWSFATNGSNVFADGVAAISMNRGGSDGNIIQFFKSNTLVGKIVCNAASVTYSTTSDYRLKEDLKDFAGLDMVSKIPVYDFKWKTNEIRSYGVVAHELQEILPEAVSGIKR